MRHSEYQGSVGRHGRTSGTPRHARHAKPPANDGAKVLDVKVILKRTLLALAICALVLVISGVVCAVQALGLTVGAKSVLNKANQLESALSSSDAQQAAKLTEDITVYAADLKATTSQPQWYIASFIPVVGHDIYAVRTVADVLDDCSSNVLVPLSQVLATTPLDSLVNNSTINVEGCQAILNAVNGTAPVMQRCTDKLATIGTLSLGSLNQVVSPVVDKFQQLNKGFQAAAALAPFAQNLLGTNGTATYLIAAQNSAEIRATGGFPGSIGTLTVEEGRFALGDFTTPFRAFPADTPEVVAADQLTALFGHWVKNCQDTGYNPDFPFSAQAWATGYEEKQGVRIAGVFSLVPSVVQDVLAITGPITLSDGTALNKSNATKVLEHDLYWKYESDSSLNSHQANAILDDLFEEAAKASFQALVDNLDSKKLMKFAQVLVKNVEANRIYIWLNDAQAQTALDPLDCSGALTSVNSASQIGVFFTSTVNKLGWYFDIDSEILSTTPQLDGSTLYKVRTTFSSALTQEEKESGPGYIVGYDGKSYPCIYLYTPTGATFESFTSSACTFREDAQQNRQVRFIWQADYDWDQPLVCEYTVKVPAGVEALTFRTTPTLTEYR